MSKNLLLVAFTTFASTSAFASEIVCEQPGAAGHKFYATRGLPGMEQKAQLKIPGERSKRKMSCAIPAIMPRPGRIGGGDQTYPIMFCSENGDTGYSVRVSGGGHLGMIASVSFTGKYDTKPSDVTVIRCDNR